MAFRNFLEIKCSTLGMSGSFALKLLSIDEDVVQFLNGRQIASGARYFELSENIKSDCMSIYNKLQKDSSDKEKYRIYVRILSKIEENSPYFFVTPNGKVSGGTMV